MQDEFNGISLGDLIQRVDYSTLTSLYVIDCRLQLEGDELFEGLRLKSLVLSSCRMRQIPASVFRMTSLEVRIQIKFHAEECRRLYCPTELRLETERCRYASCVHVFMLS